MLLFQQFLVFSLIFLCQLQTAFNQLTPTTRRQSQQTIEIKVLEETPIDTEILDLKEDLKTSSLVKNITNGVLSLVNNSNGYFLLKPGTNKITIGKRLDRETICSSSVLNCYTRLYLQITGSKTTETVHINIEILDINDNAPEFKKSSNEKNVSEFSTPGVLFHITPAVDLDLGKNSELTYSLMPSSGTPFQLSIHRDSHTKVIDLKLELVSKLDREIQDFYKLVVVATDSGEPPLSGSTVLNIHILDENDNHPVFESANYRVNITSEHPMSQPVVTVKAYDADEGENAKIKYFFTRETAAVYRKLFSINAETGEITLVSKPSDHSNPVSPYRLVVLAEDSGMDQVPAKTNVEIRVVYSNTHVPVITLESQFLGSDPTNLIIEENNENNLAVANVVVHDPDIGRDGIVDCKLSKTDMFGLIRVDINVFQLVVQHSLDYESQGVYKIKIACEDMGSPSFATSLNVNLIVTDVDDNPPIFSSHHYVASIDENNSVGATIVKLEVQDSDIDPAHIRVDFFIEPHFEHLFTVEQNSGTVKALVSFDREQTDRYSFHVFAKGGKMTNGDNSSYKHVTKTKIDLTILDVDDESPKFERPWYRFQVFENQIPGSIVGTVKAVDSDLPPNNLFHYSLALISSTDATQQYAEELLQNQLQKPISSLPFGIDAASGKIFTKTPLDRESQSQYEFKVFAKNESTTVFVDVTDMNDNPPVWTFPKSDSCINTEVILLRGNLTFGQTLTTLKAVDTDFGKNAEIIYAITSGNEHNQFSLEAKSGKLSWNSYLSGLTTPHACHTRLTFQAQNIDRPPLTSDISCLGVTFEECLAHQERLHKTTPVLQKEPQAEGSQTNKNFFSDFYFLIIIIVLLCCIVIAIILTAAICITRQQTRAMKREKLRQSDLRASIPLSSPDSEAVLVLDRSSAHNESSDQLTGILVSLRSAEQLGRLQLRSLAPSKDSLMSTSTSIHRERDADSGYADVSPV